MKIKTYHSKSHRFLKRSRVRHKNSPLRALAVRKINCYHEKQRKLYFLNCFKKILGNISEGLTSGDNRNKVIKQGYIFNLYNVPKNFKIPRKYKNDMNYKTENRLQRKPCKIIHTYFQSGKCTAVYSSTRNITSRNDTNRKQDFCKSRPSKSLVSLTNAKIMSSNYTCMLKRLPFTNNNYKKREDENKILIKYLPSSEEHWNDCKSRPSQERVQVQHTISAFNNILLSNDPKAETDNRTTVISGSKENTFNNKYTTEEQVTKILSDKVNMMQRCQYNTSTSHNMFLQKLTNELSECKKIHQRRATFHNFSYKYVNNKTKYRLNHQLNKSSVRRKISIIGCHLYMNQYMRIKRFFKKALDRKYVNHYREYYSKPLKRQRRTKYRQTDIIANKCFKKMSYGIENYVQLGYDKYFSSSQEYKQNSFCASSMLMRDPFINCYKQEYNIFNLQFTIPKYTSCTNIYLSNYKKYEANTFSLHEINTWNTYNNSKDSKSIKKWCSRPNISSVSYFDNGIRNNNEYRHETPFCFEIPPIETRAVQVKFSRYEYEGCGIPEPPNSDLYHLSQVKQECNKPKLPILGKILSRGQMQLKKITGNVKEKKMLVKKIRKKIMFDTLKGKKKCQKQNICGKNIIFHTLKIIKNYKKQKICVNKCKNTQCPIDVGFRTSFNFNIGVRKIPRAQQIRSSTKCVFGKHLMSYLRL